MTTSGSHFEELPTTSVEIEIAADADTVWALVSDPTLPAGQSDELYRAEWVAPATGPELGARIHGWNRRVDNEWETFSTVTRCDVGECFEWTVDSLHPGEQSMATWAFEIEPAVGSEASTATATDVPRVIVRQRATLGPGRSGLTEAIAAVPDHRQRIIDGRLAQQAAAMQANLDAIKVAAESGT